MTLCSFWIGTALVSVRTTWALVPFHSADGMTTAQFGPLVIEILH